jgi:hypothetical protein
MTQQPLTLTGTGPNPDAAITAKRNIDDAHLKLCQIAGIVPKRFGDDRKTFAVIAAQACTLIETLPRLIDEAIETAFESGKSAGRFQVQADALDAAREAHPAGRVGSAVTVPRFTISDPIPISPETIKGIETAAIAALGSAGQIGPCGICSVTSRCIGEGKWEHLGHRKHSHEAQAPKGLTPRLPFETVDTGAPSTITVEHFPECNDQCTPDAHHLEGTPAPGQLGGVLAETTAQRAARKRPVPKAWRRDLAAHPRRRATLVRDARRRRDAGESWAEIAASHGVSRTTIQNVIADHAEHLAARRAA